MAELGQDIVQPNAFRFEENRRLISHISVIESNLGEIPHYYFGGLAVDGNLGRETRPHNDIDMWVVGRENYDQTVQTLQNLGFRLPHTSEMKALRWVKDGAIRLFHGDGTVVDIGALGEDNGQIYLPIDALDGRVDMPQGAFEGVGHLGGVNFPTISLEALYLLKHGAVFGSRHNIARLIPMWAGRGKDRDDLLLLRENIDPAKVQVLLNEGWMYVGKNPATVEINTFFRRLFEKNADIDVENYRGLATDRGLSSQLNRRDGYPGRGVFEILSIGMDDLAGKRVLDVGVGGGRALEHAMEVGLDYHGVDILPLVDANNLAENKRQNVLEMQRRFLDTSEKFPGRLTAADFCTESIPFEDNSFDVVLSAKALPGYARDPNEARLAINNMIRLAREKVIINGGWNEKSNPSGLVYLGGGGGELFAFRMKEYLDSLSERGITYQLRQAGTVGIIEWVIDIDVRGKK